jgi:hypothetical protein
LKQSKAIGGNAWNVLVDMGNGRRQKPGEIWRRPSAAYIVRRVAYCNSRGVCAWSNNTRLFSALLPLRDCQVPLW